MRRKVHKNDIQNRGQGRGEQLASRTLSCSCDMLRSSRYERHRICYIGTHRNWDYAVCLRRKMNATAVSSPAARDHDDGYEEGWI
jgi:hypothetical protein